MAVCYSETKPATLSKFFPPTDAQLDNLKKNFKFALKLTLKSSKFKIVFLRLSDCASVGGKNFDNYQDAWNVCVCVCVVGGDCHPTHQQVPENHNHDTPQVTVFSGPQDASFFFT